MQSEVGEEILYKMKTELQVSLTFCTLHLLPCTCTVL